MSPYFNDSFGAREWKAVSSFISHSRPNTQTAIFRSDLMVIYSTIDDFVPGQTVTEEEIISLIQTASPRYGYTFESPPWLRPRSSASKGAQNSKIFVLMKTDRDAPRPHRPPNPMVQMARVLLGVIAVILVFVIIMALLIARSITQSVLVLEQATRRIAAGELDTAIDIKGSNEITSLTSSLNHMRLALKEDEQRRSRFIMGITHDLKTPLALIKGYAEAIGDGVTADPVSRLRSVEIIAAKVDQLEGMIDDLIDFVRVDSGEWRRALVKVNLAAFLSSFTKRVKDDAELLNRRVEVNIDIPADLLIPMDERLAVRALENLVNNSLRYTQEGGLVRIAAYMEGRSGQGPRSAAVIEVSDNGPGIDEKDLPHVFEVFYRGSASRREQGMGLGLSVVKGVADSHGWEISVESGGSGAHESSGTNDSSGLQGSFGFQGSRFRIVIPV
jgi:signal transduction histidine kinase